MAKRRYSMPMRFEAKKIRLPSADQAGSAS
jgi:hypothetical protein